MKPASKSPFTKFLALCLGLVGIFPLGSHFAKAADGTWDNGGADNNWRTTTNWNPDGLPGSTTAASFASTETATFGTTGSGTINLGDFINIRTIIFGVSSGDAGAFTIGDANDTLNLSNNGAVTVNAGVTTAQNIGVAGTTINTSTTGGAATTFTNNGSGLLTIAGNLAANVASGNGLLAVGGSGDTTVTGTITKPGAGSNALLKIGSGTLTLSNGSTWNGTGAIGRIPATAAGFPLVAREGTLLLNGGTHTVTGEAVIGGVVADGGAGQNAKIQVDAGALNISSWLSIGRGNGVGNVSSDLVLNNAATITAGMMSAGFNGGSALNLPKGTITLNNSSALSINTNGAFQFAESAGSNFTMTLNDSSTVTVNGAGSATNRYIGNTGATGVLTMNGTSSFSGGTSILNVGYQTGTGTINLNSGTFALASELRVGATNVNGAFAGGSGTVNVAGGTMTLNALTVARANDAAGKLSGTMNVSSGTLTVSSGATILGFNGDGTTAGTVNVTGGAFNSNGSLTILGTANSGRGVLNINGGTFTSVNDIYLGENASSSGNITLTSGTFNVGTTAEKWMQVNRASSGSSSVTVNGGTMNLNTNSDIRFAVNAAATGINTFTMNGGLVQGQTGNANGIVSASSVLDMNQGATGAANNTFNLNGGTLLIGQVLSNNANNAGGSRTFNFNGGTLKAAATQTAFFNLGSGTGTARANVRNGGAIIDTNTFDVTVAQALERSNIGGDNATDGGLRKNGAGTLTMTGANTYTGVTTVNSGTLKAGAASVANVSGAFGNNSAVTMANVAGATLDITGFNTQIGSLTGGGATGGNVSFGSATLTVGGDNTSPAAFAGQLTSSNGTGGTLIKIGSGTLSLTNTSNNYSGTNTNALPLNHTQINAGTLGISGDGVLGLTGGGAFQQILFTGNGTLQDTTNNVSLNSFRNIGINTGATATFDSNGNTFTIGGIIQNNSGNTASGIAKIGSGTVALTSANTYSGATTVSAGTLRSGIANALPSGSAVTVAGNAAGVTATLDLNGNNNTLASLALGGATSTSGAAVTTGAGTLTLGGNVTYSATNNPLGGTIAGNLALGGADRTFTIGNSSSAAADLTVSALISGGNGVIKQGAGTLVFTNNNTYGGFGTSIAGGILQVGDGSSTNGSVSGGTVFLDNNAAISLNKANGGTLGNLIQINPSGGTVRGDNAAGTTNSYTSTVFSDNAGGTGTITSTNSGATIQFTAATAFDIKGNTYTFNGAGDTNVTGAIVNGNGGTGSIVKDGTGTLKLTGANSYTGATTVAADGGTLSLDNAGSTTARLAGTSGITVNTGGTLLLASSSGTSTDRINNNATVALVGGTLNAAGLSEGDRTTAGVGALTLTGNSIIDFGTTVGSNTFVHFAASDSQTWSGNLDIYNWTGSTANTAGNGTDQLLFGTSNTSLLQSQLNEIRFFSDAGTTFLGTGAFTTANFGEVVPVPEPATVFGAFALVGMIGYRERKRLPFTRAARRATA